MSKTPFDFITAVAAFKPVYGPGRGAASDEGLLVTRDVRPGGAFSEPSFHCSSWTNFLAHAFSGREPEDYTSKGNMPNMIRLCQRSGLWRWPTPWAPGRHIPIQTYGDLCTDLGQVSPAELQALLTPCCRQRLFLVGESTRIRGVWKYWHHTSAWVVMPDGRIFRAAADGYRSRAKGYSRTPFSFSQVSPTFFNRVRLSKKYWAFEMDWKDFRGEVSCEPSK